MRKNVKGFSNGTTTNVTSLADLDLDEIKEDANIDDYFDLLEMIQEEIIVYCENSGRVSKFQSFDLSTMDSDEVSQTDLVDLLQEMQLDLKVLRKNNMTNSTNFDKGLDLSTANEKCMSLDDDRSAQ